MAGYVKKGASTWSPAIPSIYVKTGSNTWAAATSAWIKINDLNDSTSWKQWFTGSVIDSFTRTTSGSLGNADLGGTWVNGVFSGTTGWYANGSTAFNSDSQGSGTTVSAWSSVEVGSNNSFAEVATSGGVGPMVWANYSGSTPTTWWAAIPYKIETATPYEYYANYRCNNTTTCNTCTSASACGTTTTPFSYAATANYVYQGSITIPGTDYGTPTLSTTVYQGSITVAGTDFGPPTLSTTVYQGSVTVGGSYLGAPVSATVQSSTYATCRYSCSPSEGGPGGTLGGVGNTSCYEGGSTTCTPSGVGCTTNGASYSTTTVTSVKTCNQTYGTGVVNSTQGSCSYPVSPFSDGGCETGTSGFFRGCKGTNSSTVSGTCSCTTSSGYLGPAACVRGENCAGSGLGCCSGTYCTTTSQTCSTASGGPGGTLSGGGCYSASSSGCAGSYSGSPAGTACSYEIPNSRCAQGTLSGGRCYGASTTGCAGSYTGSPAGSSCAYTIPNSACAQGTLSGGRCIGPSTTGCAGSYTGSPAGSSCSYFSGYTCPNGGTLSGSTCSGTTVTANTCASCNPNDGPGCGTTTVSGGTYNPNTPPLYGCSNGYTFDTLIGYNYSYSYGIKIVQGSGSSYTVISDTATSAFAAVVRVSTSGNTLTVNAWSDTAKSTQVATNVTATNSSTKGTKCGIVRAYSQYQQGNTADNFSAGVI
jgi:hypothetical protein